MGNVGQIHQAIDGGLPLIGSPVKQVKTPPLINARLQNLGSDLRMIPVEITPEEVPSFFRVLRASDRVRGCSCTIPYKRQVFAQMDVATSEATRLQVVNTVRRDRKGALFGCMTDGMAMLQALRNKGVDPHGAVVLVIGAGGGAGRAIADALASANVSRIDLVDPNREQLAACIEALSESFQHTVFCHEDPSGPWDIIINASPLGSHQSDPLPVSDDQIANCSVVGDAVTTREVTDLIGKGLAQGATTVSGHEMARAQIDLQMQHWEL